MTVQLRTFRKYEDGKIDVPSNSRIGRYCFFPKRIEKHYFGKMPKDLLILDVACGGAADHALMHHFFDKKGVNVKIIGVDVKELTLEITKNGRVSYPLETDLEVNDQGGIFFEKGAFARKRKKEAYFPRNISKLFTDFLVYNGLFPGEIKLHIDEGVNTKGGRWVMNREYRERLNLICADATQLPFKDGAADIVIAENFLFGRSGGIFDRINAELDRVLKPNGLYLGDGKNKPVSNFIKSLSFPGSSNKN